MLAQHTKVLRLHNKIYKPTKSWLFYSVALSFLMQMLDATAVNTAITPIATSLNILPTTAKVCITSYLLSLALFIPSAGYLEKRIGSRKLFIIAISIFTASSLGCALAKNLQTLVIARIMQGMGGAWISPIGRLLLMRQYEHKHSLFMKIMNRYAAIGLIGGAIGPAVGGFMTYQLSWHWIFYINLPIGLAILIVVYKILPQDKASTKTAVFDKMGFCLLGAALICWVLSINNLSHVQLHTYKNVLLIGITLLFLVCYKSYAKKHKTCLLPIGLFSYKPFRLACMGNLWFRLCVGGIPFLIPLALQLGLGKNPEQAGLAMIPYSFGLIAAKRYAPALISTIGFKKILIRFGLLSGLLLLFFAELLPHYCLITGILILPCVGFVVSTTYSGINLLTLTNIEKKQQRYAATYSSLLQQMGNCTGICLTSLLIFTFGYITHTPFSLHDFHLTALTLALMIPVIALIFSRLHDDIHKPTPNADTARISIRDAVDVKPRTACIYHT